MGLETAENVAFFDGFALIIFFLALAGRDDEFNIAATSEKADWDELVAFDFGAGEGGELFFSDEKLNVALGIGTECEIVEPELVIFDGDEGAAKLDMVIPDQADFGAGK